MFDLTPDEIFARIKGDVAAVRRIMGPEKDAQFLGLLATAHIRGLEWGLSGLLKLRYPTAVKQAYHYGESLGRLWEST